MTITVEDGTGLANADAYASVAEYKAYHAKRGRDESAVTDAVIEAALVKATDYIDQRFRFRGYRLNPTVQALQWPREGILDAEGYEVAALPAAVKSATIEYAYRAKSTDLWNTPSTDSYGMLTSKREKVGPIETEYAYSGGFTSTIKPYPVADQYLQDLVTNLQGGNYR